MQDSRRRACGRGGALPGAPQRAHRRGARGRSARRGRGGDDKFEQE